MFGSQALRLLREAWPNVQLLAEELYAMFQDSVPLETSAPLKLTQTNPDVPALTISSDAPAGSTVVQFTNGNGDVLGGITINGGLPQPVPDSGGINLGDSAPITIGPTTGGTIDFSPGQAPAALPPPGGTTPAGGGGGGGSNAFPCQVLGGSGSSYSCKVVGAGQNGEDITASVTQKQIDPTDQIPAGTWALCVRIGGSYSMQVPVWL